MLFGAPCLCLCAFCLATVAASECPVDDFFFRGVLQLKPSVPLPDRAFVGYQLRQFYGQPPFPDADWPEGGTVVETWAGWCDPF